MFAALEQGDHDRSHPHQQQVLRREGGIRPFRIAQAHGSSHFGKMADRGHLRVQDAQAGDHGALPEEERDRMGVRFDKAKDEESMGKLDTIAVKYDRNAMNITMDVEATERNS